MIETSKSCGLNSDARRLKYCLAKVFRYPCERLSHTIPKTFAVSAKVFRCPCQRLSHTICCATKFLSLYLTISYVIHNQLEIKREDYPNKYYHINFSRNSTPFLRYNSICASLSSKSIGLSNTELTSFSSFAMRFVIPS